MIYEAAGNLCAVNFKELQLPISDEQALEILLNLGFEKQDVDIIALAYGCIDLSQYKRGATIDMAPKVVDCSTFISWLYSQKGVKLPRYSIDQRDRLSIVIDEENLQPGDLVFTSGRFNYYWNDPTDGVGHVGIYTGNNTVIHAAGPEVGVIEDPFTPFAKNSRGIRRVIDDFDSVVTIKSPPSRVVGDSQEFRWIILQQC